MSASQTDSKSFFIYVKIFARKFMSPFAIFFRWLFVQNCFISQISKIIIFPINKTFFAISFFAIGLNTCVFFCKFVSSNAMRLFCIYGSGTSSSQSINSSCDWLQMGWIYTRSISTKMVKLKSFWNFTDVKKIRKSMNQVTLIFEPIVSISITILSPKPNPTIAKRGIENRHWPQIINHFFESEEIVHVY